MAQSGRNALAGAVIVALGGWHLGARSQTVQDLLHPPTRMERALRRHLGVLELSPGYHARIAGVKNSAVASAMGKEAAQRGLRRLPGADLERWNRLRMTLADGSPDLCAGFWSGVFDPGELTRALERLPDAELDDWLRISTFAAELDLDRRGEPPAPDDTIEHTIDAVSARLPADEAARLRRDIAAGLSLDGEEGCSAMKTLMRNVAALDLPLRRDALRAIAAF